MRPACALLISRSCFHHSPKKQITFQRQRKPKPYGSKAQKKLLFEDHSTRATNTCQRQLAGNALYQSIMPLLKVEAVVDLDSLVNSANEVEADGGEKVEAMLGRRLRRCWGEG